MGLSPAGEGLRPEQTAHPAGLTPSPPAAARSPVWRGQRHRVRGRLRTGRCGARARVPGEAGAVVPSTEEETEAQTGVGTCPEPPSQQAGPQLSPQTRLFPPAPAVSPRGERGETGMPLGGWEGGLQAPNQHPPRPRRRCPPHPAMGSRLPEPQGLPRTSLWRMPHRHAPGHAHACAHACKHTTRALHTRYTPHICVDTPCTTHMQTHAHTCSHNTRGNAPRGRPRSPRCPHV